jgi:hypothetical protein
LFQTSRTIGFVKPIKSCRCFWNPRRRQRPHQGCARLSSTATTRTFLLDSLLPARRTATRSWSRCGHTHTFTHTHTHTHTHKHIFFITSLAFLLPIAIPLSCITSPCNWLLWTRLRFTPLLYWVVSKCVVRVAPGKPDRDSRLSACLRGERHMRCCCVRCKGIFVRCGQSYLGVWCAFATFPRVARGGVVLVGVALAQQHAV